MSLDNFLLKRARVSGKRHPKVTLDDKMTLFQQLASLVASGVPLMQALEIAAEQSESDRLSAIVSEIAMRVSAGVPLHAAFTAHRDVFADHWIALIATGEATGQMEQVLTDLNEQIRESQETRRKLKGALTYPIILLAVAIMVVVVMLWFVVPVFSDMFEEMGAELPGITQFVVTASRSVVDYGLVVALVAGTCGYGIRRYSRTEGGRRQIGAFLLATPLTGELTVNTAMYRFTSNLALLLKSGVPMLDTLTALSGVFRNQPAYQDAILIAQRRVAAGRSLADSLADSGLFTNMVVSMIRVGEESAQLPYVMGQIAPYYREKMNAFLTKFTKLLEPCIIMIMGLTIAVVMLAIYIPMFEMSGKVG